MQSALRRIRSMSHIATPPAGGESCFAGSFLNKLLSASVLISHCFVRSVSFFRSGLCVVSRLAFFRALCGGKGDGQLLFCINAALAGRLYRNRNRFSGCVVLQLFFQLLNGADGLTIEFCDDVNPCGCRPLLHRSRSNACYINTCGDAIAR